MGYSSYSGCRDCPERNPEYSPIRPSIRSGSGPTVMFIGQDPTIRKKQDRVESALMLEDTGSQIYRWLSEVFNLATFNNFNIYATNIVKCILNKVPTDTSVGGLVYLFPCFQFCKRHLLSEITEVKPQYIFTLGEPAHQFFIASVENREDFKNIRMQDCFNGGFIRLTYNSLTFQYSPILHIQGYRVAKKYGHIVLKFETEIQKMSGF